MDAELAELARAISHDFKKPLRQVRSFAQLLERRHGGQLDAEGRELLDHVVRGAARMQGQLEAFVESIRFVGGPMEPSPVALDDALDAALASLGARLAETQASVSREPLPSLRGDRQLLERLLRELLANALAAAGSAPPRIEVGVEGAAVFVRDHGEGLDPSAGERIFGWFSKLGPVDLQSGHGVGLALCRRIVEHHGGCIWAESAVGQGATFRFTLAPDGAAPPTGRLGPPGLAPPSGRILLVEDDPIVRHAVSVILRREGYEVAEVVDGAQALERFAAVAPDLVLMDLQMPGIDGLAAARGIRAAEKAGRRVPILALTAHTTSGEREHCQDAGMDGHVSKPFSAADLLRVIRQHVEGEVPAGLPPPPRARRGTEAAVFARSQALANCRGDPALLGEIARMFEAACPAAVQRVRDAVEAGDAAGLTAAAHRLKGMSANLGGQALSAAASALEGLGRRDALEPAPAALDALEGEAARLLAALQGV